MKINKLFNSVNDVMSDIFDGAVIMLGGFGEAGSPVELIHGLIAATKVLKKNGILAVVTFHSLEDKIVKYFFKSLSEKKSISRYMPNINQPETLFSMVEKKPITPSAKELRENTPSRSAKLRYVIKKNDFYNFETDIVKKFKTLLDIENFGEKL